MRAYRVHKFQPGGYIRPLSLCVAAAFFYAGVVKRDGVCWDGVAKRYPIEQHSLFPHEWRKIRSILSASFGTTAEGVHTSVHVSQLVGKILRHE